MKLTPEQGLAGRLWVLSQGLQDFSLAIAERSQGALTEAGVLRLAAICFEWAGEYETPDLWANELPDGDPFHEYRGAMSSFLTDYRRATKH